MGFSEFFFSLNGAANIDYTGATDQSPAIQALIDAASPGDTILFGPGDIQLGDRLTIPKNLKLVGFHGTKFNCDIVNKPIFVMQADFVELHNFEIVANGRTNSLTNQFGILVSNAVGWKISNINMNGLYTGIRTTNTNSDHRGGIISNCNIENCNTGIQAFSGGSFLTIDNCKSNINNIGFDIGTGNVSLVGCHANTNQTGILFSTNINSGHNTICGGIFNHNTTNIDVQDAVHGLTFTGVEAWAGGFVIDASRCHFIGCQLSPTGNFTFNSNVQQALFQGCTIHGTPSSTGAGSTNVIWDHCYNDSLTLYTG